MTLIVALMLLAVCTLAQSYGKSYYRSTEADEKREDDARVVVIAYCICGTLPCYVGCWAYYALFVKPKKKEERERAEREAREQAQR